MLECVPNIAGLLLMLHMIAATITADVIQDETLLQRVLLDATKDAARYTQARPLNLGDRGKRCTVRDLRGCCGSA